MKFISKNRGWFGTVGEYPWLCYVAKSALVWLALIEMQLTDVQRSFRPNYCRYYVVLQVRSLLLR